VKQLPRYLCNLLNAFKKVIRAVPLLHGVKGFGTRYGMREKDGFNPLLDSCTGEGGFSTNLKQYHAKYACPMMLSFQECP